MDDRIKCIAIDDEPMALEKLCSYISKIPFLELVAGFDSPLDAANLINSSEVDAMFIDINMPDVNGLEFVHSLDKPPLTVFITAYSEFAVESYRVKAVDYILKPYSFADFQASAERLSGQWRLLHQTGVAKTDKDCIFLKVDYRYLNVRFSDIVYIEGMNEYLKVHLNGDKGPLVTLASFKSLRPHLPSDFIQVHRSYIINTAYIQEVSRNGIVMQDGACIGIGDTFRDSFNQYLTNKVIGKKIQKEL